MKRAASIQINELTKTASSVAKDVMADHVRRLGIKHVEVGIFPDIGIVGLIIGPLDLKQVNPAEMFELSTKITAGMGALAEGARPTLRFDRDFGTVGYFPSGPIILDQLQW